MGVHQCCCEESSISVSSIWYLHYATQIIHEIQLASFLLGVESSNQQVDVIGALIDTKHVILL